MSERIRVSKVSKLGYKAFKIRTLMTERWQVVLLISLFWSGLIIGCIYVNSGEGETLEKMRDLISGNLSSRVEYTSFQLFKNAIFKYSVFLILSFFLGLSGVGYPFVCAVPLLCGISNGLITGYLYGTFGIKGFLYCLVTMYPSMVLSLVALIVGSCESLEMSLNIFKILADKNRISKENLLRKYGYQFFILFSLVVASGITETIVCNLFLHKFNLF